MRDMTSKSLTDRLQELRHQLYVDGFREDGDTILEAIAAMEGEAPNGVLSREEDTLFDIMYAAMAGAARTPLSLVDVADAGLQALKPYLRTTEPVSVSLEKCARAVWPKLYSTGNYDMAVMDGAPSPGHDCIRRCNGIAKAVLDAAGVPHVN